MLEVGMLLRGRYNILSQVGKGGMGTVFLAKDENLGITVAVKQNFFDEQRLIEAFKREARLLAGLRHSALPQVKDYFIEGTGQYLVMEYIAGDDLGTVLQRNRNGNQSTDEPKPFEVLDVVRWAEQLLDALDYLHTRAEPIVHRDIKPQNLKLAERNQIILLDFGLAKGKPLWMTRVTTTGSLYGYTPNYAPIEQIRGVGTDPRSDLYALGATLYHLITGVPPIDSATRADAFLGKEPDPLLPANHLNPKVSYAVTAALMKAMEPHRNYRFSSAAEMLDALRNAKSSTVVDWQARKEVHALGDTVRQNENVWVTTELGIREQAEREHQIPKEATQGQEEDGRKATEEGESLRQEVGWARKEEPERKELEEQRRALEEAERQRVEAELKIEAQREADRQQREKQEQEAKEQEKETLREEELLEGERGLEAQQESERQRKGEHKRNAKVETERKHNEEHERKDRERAERLRMQREMELQAQREAKPQQEEGEARQTKELVALRPLQELEHSGQEKPLAQQSWGAFVSAMGSVAGRLLSHVSRGSPRAREAPRRTNARAVSLIGGVGALILIVSIWYGVSTPKESEDPKRSSKPEISGSQRSQLEPTRAKAFMPGSIATPSRVVKVAVNDDGSILASAGDEETSVRLWQTGGASELIGHKENATSVALSHDGQFVCSGSNDGMIRLWSVSEGQLIKSWSGHSYKVFSVGFSLDGTTLYSAGGDKDIKFWRLTDAVSIKTVSVPEKDCVIVAVSPDLGSAGFYRKDDGSFKVWSLVSNHLINALRDRIPSLDCGAFSKDGLLLALGTGRSIQIWRLVTDGRVDFQGVDAQVVSIALSSDGQSLAAGFSSGALKLWDVQDGRLMQEFVGHKKQVNSLAFSGDGRLLVSGSDDKTVRIWEVAER